MVFKSKSHQMGFTLLEVIVAAAIIGTLARIILPKIASARDKATAANVATEVQQIKSALQLYYDDYGTFPDDPSIDVTQTSICLKASGTCFAGLQPSSATIVNKLKPYLAKIPNPPVPPYGNTTYLEGSFFYRPNYYYGGSSGGLAPGTYITWAQPTPLSPTDPRCPASNVNPINGSTYSLQYAWFVGSNPTYYYCQEKID